MARSLANDQVNRNQETSNENIADKAMCVAQYLGTYVPSKWDWSRGTSVYDDQGLLIRYEEALTAHGSGNHIVVFSNGQNVLDERNGQRRIYVPGVWEEVLDLLYEVARRKADEALAARSLEAAQKRAERESAAPSS